MLHTEYILGLVDGEGSFTAYVRNLDDSRERKRRVRVEPKFYLKLIEEDKHVLYELREFFRCGNVYFQKDSRKNHRDCYRYEVSKREDIQKRIIPFFKRHRLKLRSKQRDFVLFCQIMDMISEGEHRTPAGLKRIYEVKQKMH